MLAPLRSTATVRAGVLLVVGGVVAGAYAALVAGFAQMFASLQTPRVATVVLALVTAVLASTPRSSRPCARSRSRRRGRSSTSTCRSRDRGRPAGAATRWRAAAWYALHLALGAAVVVVVLFGVPVATQLVLSATGVEPVLLADWRPWEALPAWTWLLTAVLVLLAVPYVVALARAVLRQAALPLLGPDQTEQIAELEAAADRAAERGRLARELHDSVGHALTVTTLQAAAAARLLDTDPPAARRALAAIEETGRSAMADLDHVLGLLRAEVPGAPPRAPARTLADLDALLDDARGTGADVRLARDGAAPPDVPRAVSQEAYRVVQEALTNALRHAPGEPVAVAVAPGPAARWSWRCATRSGRGTRRRAPDGDAREHRGLAGMRERAHLLRGEVAAGPAPDGGAWVVRATFPRAGSSR